MNLAHGWINKNQPLNMTSIFAQPRVPDDSHFDRRDNQKVLVNEQVIADLSFESQYFPEESSD
jgi:hypothetical protein